MAGPVRCNQLDVCPVGFVDSCAINNQVAGIKLDQILDFLPSDLRLRFEALCATGRLSVRQLQCKKLPEEG